MQLCITVGDCRKSVKVKVQDNYDLRKSQTSPNFILDRGCVGFGFEVRFPCFILIVYDFLKPPPTFLYESMRSSVEWNLDDVRCGTTLAYHLFSH